MTISYIVNTLLIVLFDVAFVCVGNNTLVVPLKCNLRNYDSTLLQKRLCFTISHQMPYVLVNLQNWCCHGLLLCFYKKKKTTRFKTASPEGRYSWFLFYLLIFFSFIIIFFFLYLFEFS